MQHALRATLVAYAATRDRACQDRGAVTDRQAGPPADTATQALEDLIVELAVCISDLQQALGRAEQLRQQRRSGQSWLDIVVAESRPLIVERITYTLKSLNNAGGRWRREQACALLDEGVSINRIATLFGVTRQRISTLVRRRNGDLHQIGQPDRLPPRRGSTT